ncbi:hypothetical protein R1sor_010296 [Riccia sorocarpa]|uniref:Uncharacterized protein n=1 Tax=Riccia sorocarpa TaxID=122646 RepID=A0ABD3I164_9MARC
MADNIPVYKTQKDVDGPWTPEGGLCLWTKVDGHILVPTGEPKALQLPTSHRRLGEVSPFIDNLVKCLQETYNDPTSEGYRKYTPVVEYWKTLKQRLTNINSLPSDTLQTRFWPKTDHGTGFNPLVVSGETAVTAVISGDLVVDDLERELNEENDVQPEHYIPRAIWLGRAMGSVVRDTTDEHHEEFLVEWWRPRHRKSMNATDKERYSAILVGQKDWEKDPGYVRPQWINASAAIYSWKYRSKESSDRVKPCRMISLFLTIINLNITTRRIRKKQGSYQVASGRVTMASEDLLREQYHATGLETRLDAIGLETAFHALASGRVAMHSDASPSRPLQVKIRSSSP